MDEIINSFQALTLNQLTVEKLVRLDNLLRNAKERLRDDWEKSKTQVRQLITSNDANVVEVNSGGHRKHPGVPEGKWWFIRIRDLSPGEHTLIRGAVREHVDRNRKIYVRLYDGNVMKVRWNIWHA